MKHRSMTGMVLILGLAGCTGPASSEPATGSAVSAASASEVEMVSYTCACGKTKSVEISADVPHC